MEMILQTIFKLHLNNPLVLCILVALFSSCAGQEENSQDLTAPASVGLVSESTPPNILLLIADDLGVEQLASFGIGSQPANTPNLDRLVNMGTSLTHAYNMGGWNGAICVASRAMIISGSYIWNA